MFKDRKKSPGMQARNRMSASGCGDGENGCYSSSGLRSGYIAQGAVPGLKYALTMNGYMVL